jgi:hypothetical protein
MHKNLLNAEKNSLKWGIFFPENPDEDYQMLPRC